MPSGSSAIAWIAAAAIAGLVGASLRIGLRPPPAMPPSVTGKGSPSEALLPLPRAPGHSPAAEPTQTALVRFWADNPNCAAATNGCQVCLRGSESSCSMPGIACQPAEWRCQ
jgi:hypothetical protein